MKPFVLALFLLLPAAAFAQPSVAFDAVHHDFGTVMEGPLLEHAFAVVNTGTEELVIRDVNTS